MSDWNYADVWEAIAGEIPEQTAQIHGEQHISWRSFNERANGIAHALIAAGVQQQDKVALYVYNGPEYLEGVFAAFKIGLVPVNTNYRYREHELRYLWDNADATAVVFHGAFTETIEPLRADLPKIRCWLWVDDGTGPCPAWASSFEEAAASNPAPADAPWRRSGEDIVMIYTGGTTGLPKGVMWRQDDQFRAFDTAGLVACGDTKRLAQKVASSKRPIGLPACPLMHGTGFLFACTTLNQGGTVVTLPGTHFKPEALLDAVVRNKITGMAIVGDAFCRPIVEELDAQPGRWDLSSLGMVASAGVMWSAEFKERFLAYAPDVVLADLLGSTEAHGMGRSISGRGAEANTARFSLGEHAFVIDEDGNHVEPGSGQIGRIAVRGLVPVGYYKDPEKSAQTFPVIDGVRCAVPGDYATVESDGTIALLGRGSVCINTGGEKVFPEEVEEALKTHPQVRDCVVVGVPHERFGQSIAAAVEMNSSPKGLAHAPVESAELIAHAKHLLASYKAPRHILVVDSISRAPNGKADYAGIRKRVEESIAASQN